MKLLRLKLASWRGVESREVEFVDGVTLVEGPNEIGKSTIVEALQSLFSTMHSSSAGAIKAIQPVGQDVGSSVEAEVKAGDYHFIYAKTYNRDKQATLKVLAPQPEQLTGREAHERAEQILEESVDMTLWKALLVEQGSEIAGVTLSQSDGLARALDEAAGGSSPDQDDSDLFGRVQTEYEKYFTLKTGKPKYASLESDLNSVRLEVQEAKAALLEVETDSDEHERIDAEVRRLKEALPELRESVSEHEANWQAINTIKEQVKIKRAALDAAQQLSQVASDDQARRNKLVRNREEGAAELKKVREQLVPQLAQLTALKEVNDTDNAALSEAKNRSKQARRAAEFTREDEQYLKRVGELAVVNRQLEQLKSHNENLAAARKVLLGIKIDTNGLEELREAAGAMQVAVGKLDAATSSIEIEAENNLRIMLNDEELEFVAGVPEKRDISAELIVGIPGTARIRIVPSQSANDLETEATECQEDLTRLLTKYGVKDLADAVAVDARRATAEQDVDSWSEKIEEQLDGASETDRRAYAEDRQARCDNYLAARPSQPALPVSLQVAIELREAAENLLAEIEEGAEKLQVAFDRSREAYSEANAHHLVAEQELTGLERAADERQQLLDEARDSEDDVSLQKRIVELQTNTEKLQTHYDLLNEQLASASPDTEEVMLSNARAASQRVEKDLHDQNTQLAILEDRLTKAQANGRFETLETAEARLAAREAEFAAMQARAMAARRLWDTLNTHRNAARKVYVRPLKEGIEHLGKIVFGADFTIELGEDWGLVSRTQAGRTIPFDDLSVGAKEQLGILTRLAAAKIVSRQGGVPLIIDDALGFSDPSRLKTMGAAIAAAGQDCQVILLTCTPGRFMHVGTAQVVRF